MSALSGSTRRDSHVQVKLIAVDTLSFHFRQPTLEIVTRKRLMELWVEGTSCSNDAASNRFWAR